MLSVKVPPGATMTPFSSWQIWAILSAVFAACTAIFAKVVVENVNSDFATFIRTVVILGCLAVILLATGQFASPNSVSAKSWLFLVLSGFATGASWICYFRALQLGEASQVAPVDKLSVVFAIVFAGLILKEHLGWQQCVGGGLIVIGAVVLTLR